MKSILLFVAVVVLPGGLCIAALVAMYRQAKRKEAKVGM